MWSKQQNEPITNCCSPSKLHKLGQGGNTEFHSLGNICCKGACHLSFPVGSGFTNQTFSNTGLWDFPVGIWLGISLQPPCVLAFSSCCSLPALPALPAAGTAWGSPGKIRCVHRWRRECVHTLWQLWGHTPSHSLPPKWCFHEMPLITIGDAAHFHNWGLTLTPTPGPILNLLFSLRRKFA